MLRLPSRSVSYSLSPEKRTKIMLVLRAIHIQMHFYHLKPQNTKHEAIRCPRGICETKVFFFIMYNMFRVQHPDNIVCKESAHKESHQFLVIY